MSLKLNAVNNYIKLFSMLCLPILLYEIIWK